MSHGSSEQRGDKSIPMLRVAKYHAGASAGSKLSGFGVLAVDKSPLPPARTPPARPNVRRTSVLPAAFGAHPTMSLLSLPLPGARLPPGHVKIGSVGGHAIAGTSHPVAFRLLDAQAGSQAIVSPAHVAALTPQGTAAGTSASTPLGSKPCVPHWRSGQNIQLGLDLSTTMADSSVIHYPSAKTSLRQRLPQIPASPASPASGSFPGVLPALGPPSLSALAGRSQPVDGDARPSLPFESAGPASLPAATSLPPARLSEHGDRDGGVRAGWIDTASELDAHDSLAPASGRGSKTSSSTDAHERTLALPGEHLQPLSTKEIQRIVSDMLEGGSSVCIVVKQPSPNTATSRLHVPLPVAYQSGTIQHIHKCAGRFAEGRRGIEFPTIEAETMGQIIDFLNRQYLAQHWQEAKHFCTQDAASVRAPPQFEPRLETVLDVMYAGLYLDIPDLVDVCAIKAARNFSLIESLDQLPDELIASILRHATIGDALVYEAETLLRARSTTHASTPGCAAETEDESNGNECRGPLVDGSLIWRDKFWKLVSAKCELADARHNQRQAQFCGPSGHGPSRPPIRAANYLRGIWSSGSAPSPPSMHIGRETQHLLDDLDISADDAKRADEYALLCRRVCAEFYVSEVLSRLIHFDSSGTTVSRIMQLSGRTMRQLNVALTPQCDAIFPPGFWASALAMCSGLERIVVHADTVSACLREILSSGAAMQPHEFANGRVGPQAVHAGHAASSYAARRRVFDLRIQMAAIPPDSVADLIHIGALPEPGGGGANAAKRSQAADGDAAARYVRVETERAFNLRGVSSLAEFLRPQPPKTSQVSSPDSAGGPTTTSGRDMCMSRVQLTCVPAPKSRHACPGPGHFVRHMLQSTQLWVCVRKLDLSGFQLGTTGAQGVTLLVSHPRASIEHLVLRNTGLTARGVAAIFGALQQVHAAQAGTRSPASRLKALDVSATMAQSDPDITEACKAMAGYLEASPGLVELRMSDNPISSLGMISLTDALGRNTRLRVLELDGVNLGSHVKHLTQTVARHPAMEALSIRSNGVLPRGMCMLAAAWDGVPGQLAAGPCRVGSRLVSLDLSANVFDDAVAARLAGWLASGQCGLERLAMRGLGTSTQTLGSDAAAVLVEACAGAHRLAHLDLSSQNLDDVFCEAMESALPACASLSEWVLLDNTITDDGLRLVLRGMQRRVAHAGRSPVVVDLRRNWVSAEVAQSAPPQAMADKLGVLFLDGWLKSEGQGPVR